MVLCHSYSLKEKENRIQNKLYPQHRTVNFHKPAEKQLAHAQRKTDRGRMSIRLEKTINNRTEASMSIW